MKHEDLVGTEINLLRGYWFATDVLWDQRLNVCYHVENTG